MIRRLLFAFTIVLTMLACASSPNDKNTGRFTCAVSNESVAHSTVFKQYGERPIDSVRLPDKYSRNVFGLYMRALRYDRDLGGKIVFRVSVRGDGEVIGISVAHSDISDCNFIDSVFKEFQRLEFEEIKNIEDISEFLFPIDFISG